MTASWYSMPAVEPSRKLSRPAWRPADMDWMTVSRTMPKPKKTESTAPIAASSESRVRRDIHSTIRSPAHALMADPSKSPGRLRPSPPTETMMMKAIATPGSVAWATASETSARLRRNRNVPAAPAAKPSRAAPIPTSAALYPAFNRRASKRSLTQPLGLNRPATARHAWPRAGHRMWPAGSPP